MAPDDSLAGPLLTSEQVAEFLSVDVVTVRRLVSRGELAAYRVGSEYRFSRQDVSHYLERQYVPARSGWIATNSAGVRVGPGLFEHVSRALQIGIDVGRSKPQRANPSKTERFTPQAAQALTGSDEVARQRHSAAIRPVHVLLGLLQVPNSLAAQALSYFGVTEGLVLGALKEDSPEVGGATPAPEAGAGEPPTLSAEVKEALEAAVAEAHRLKHGYVGTEHLLLGLLRAEAGPVPELLARLNAPAKRVRARLLDLLKSGKE
jgi:excisionase family DNA binding protein